MSTARTMNVCRPGSSSSSRYGDSHDSNGSASNAHSNSSTALPIAAKVNTTFRAVVSSVGLS